MALQTWTDTQHLDRKQNFQMEIPSYYDILSITNHPNLSFEEIKAAYRKALIYHFLAHPARNPNLNDPARRRAQAQLRQIEIAFCVLSDESRKREYDTLLKSGRVSDLQAQYQSSHLQGLLEDPVKIIEYILSVVQETNHGASGTRKGKKTNSQFDNDETLSKFILSVCAVTTLAHVILTDPVPEELRYGKQTTPVWRYVGAVSGAALGFITGNLIGLKLGAIAGSRLGAMKDAKGKSVYEILTEFEVEGLTKEPRP